MNEKVGGGGGGSWARQNPPFATPLVTDVTFQVASLGQSLPKLQQQAWSSLTGFFGGLLQKIAGLKTDHRLRR